MKKIIIFSLIGLFFLFAGIKTLVDNPELENSMSSAVYVSDGKIDPANEGKLVILSGRLEPDLPIYDPATKVNIPYIAARRRVQIFKHIIATDYQYKWDTVTNLSDRLNNPEPTESDLIADTKIGDFNIDPELLIPLNAGRNWVDMSEEDLGDCELYVYKSKGDGIIYLSEAFSDLDRSNNTKEGTFEGRSYKEYSNKKRFSYTVCVEDPLDYTLIGVQKGDWLMKDDGVGVTNLKKGILTGEEFTANTIKSSVGIGIGTTIFGLVFLGLAGYFMVKRKRG